MAIYPALNSKATRQLTNVPGSLLRYQLSRFTDQKDGGIFIFLFLYDAIVAGFAGVNREIRIGGAHLANRARHVKDQGYPRLRRE